MSIKQIKPDLWLLDVRAWKSGKEFRRREKLQGGRKAAESRFWQIKKELQARGEAEKSSLTFTELKTFGDLLKIYKDKRTECSISHSDKIKFLEREIGAIDLRFFADRFEQYIKLLRTTNSKRTKKPRSNPCINRLVEIVRAAFNMGVSLSLMEKNPITKVRFPRLKEFPRDVVLSDLEYQNLLNVIDREAPHLSFIVRFAFQVPCRRSELVKMRKENLDLIHNTIRIKATESKNDKGCWKPIPPDMVNYFRNIPREVDFLFFRKVIYKKTGEVKYFGLGQFRRSWRRCLKLAGLKNFHFHDTRHISGTALIDNGTPEQVVMTVANWKTNMLRNYYHREPKKALQLVQFAPKTVQVSGLEKVEVSQNA
jgi:integrase